LESILPVFHLVGVNVFELSKYEKCVCEIQIFEYWFTSLDH
jgi:hypothetical protein